MVANERKMSKDLGDLLERFVPTSFEREEERMQRETKDGVMYRL